MNTRKYSMVKHWHTHNAIPSHGVSFCFETVLCDFCFIPHCKCRPHGFRIANQVWSIDITYVPMAHGHMYLVAIIDVFSRRILSWKLGNTLDASESVEVLQQAIARFGTPEIINSDQGSQYTSGLWAEACGNTMKVSMDGRGRAKDNIWIERFWRTIKREYIYLNHCDNAIELRKGIEKFMQYYNTERHHQGIDNETPERKYENNKLLIRTHKAA